MRALLNEVIDNDILSIYYMIKDRSWNHWNLYDIINI